jgi:hypothetical protein
MNDVYGKTCSLLYEEAHEIHTVCMRKMWRFIALDLAVCLLTNNFHSVNNINRDCLIYGYRLMHHTLSTTGRAKVQVTWTRLSGKGPGTLLFCIWLCLSL